MTKIWVDADSCPSIIRNYLIKLTESGKIELNFVANKIISEEKNSIRMIVCESGKDSADNYIYENAEKNDLVITRDILFAARLVDKKITVINDRGTCFTVDNIQKRLEDREYDMQMAQLGFGSKKKSFGEKEFSKFRECLDWQLRRIAKLQP